MIAFDNALIVSDIHLTASYPFTAKRFVDFCQNEARTSQAVFIIGDLFEFWVGDDAHLPSPFHLEIAKEIAQLVDFGVPVFFMAGNRDFMLGEAFKKLAHWQVLPDPTVIEVGGQSWLLSHGDSLCTADPAYQLLRTVTRIGWLQNLFLRIPIDWRKKMAEKLKRRATIKYQQKQYFDPSIAHIKGDVTLAACAKITRDMRCIRLIHGHTHRPGFHKESLGGVDWQRWVLSDWDLDHPELHPHASGLKITAQGIEVMDLIH